jgi:glycosyltransferase involved in cell wall biosynthesis
LIIDAAQVLTQQGHDVTIFTGDFDADRAFGDVRSSGLNVQVHGRLLPTEVAGHLKAPLAIARTGYVAWRAALTGTFDVIFLDLVAQVLPLLRSFTGARLIFYCHFPDKWLAPYRERLLYRLYRAPLDQAEGRALRAADKVLVNSLFTKGVLASTFPSLRRPVEVLSPGVDSDRYQPRRDRHRSDEILLLSLARYERKKGLSLAIDALHALRAQLEPELFARVRFVQAGGLSSATATAHETYEALTRQVDRLGLREHVRLETSIDESCKLDYLQRARALIYTPENEHFGIVPLEAMACGVPVVAHESGGPRETVRDGETGFLCSGNAQAFAGRLAELVRSPELASRLGASGRQDVLARWSRRVFADRLERALASLVQ